MIFIDTGFKAFGIGAEVVSRVVEEAFDALKAAPARLGIADHPTPSSRSLIADYYPHVGQLIDAVERVTGGNASTIGPVRDRLLAARRAMSVDQPDPSFQGPF